MSDYHLDIKMMKELFALGIVSLSVLLVLQSLDTPTASLYEAWKLEHGIEYSAGQDGYRKGIFDQTVKSIARHNAMPGQTYKMGLNQFSTLTPDEFQTNFLRYIAQQQTDTTGLGNDSLLAEDIDWVSKGYVTGVKNQGQCGAVWAFLATGALEALGKKMTGNLSSFSEQQLIDCSRINGNQGCTGGLVGNTFQYTKDHGITTEQAYPYTDKSGTCKPFTPVIKNAGYTDVKGCVDLYTALTGRPVVVLVDASKWSSYSSGVFSNCGTAVNHGALLVGATDAYWKLKNSWSKSWGEQGYIRLSRGNTCGLCNMPSYPY